MEERPWHAMTAAEAAQHVGTTSASGLEEGEVRRRLAAYGPNMLKRAESPKWPRILFKQFTDFMVLVLVGATIISAALGEYLDALSIVAIIVLNAVLGFIQEFRAERSLDLLRQMTTPKTIVKRNGRPIEIDAADVVPGDILVLKEGDRVPADARIASAAALMADESPLTGESHPVTKDARWIGTAETELADRRNMLYMGTTIVKGRCKGIVVATGMNTQIGDIATLIHGAQYSETPLQKRLNQLGKGLVASCLIVVALVFALGVLRGFGVFTMFLTGVSLAVAAIPEGLPAVVTIALALGVQRMIRRHAVVRRLPAVETLGCTTVICSDKTGTLTKNEMTVTTLYISGETIEVTGDGYAPRGKFFQDGVEIDPTETTIRRALEVAAFCNDARLLEEVPRHVVPGDPDAKKWRVVGDPTEAALKVLARKGGVRGSQAVRVGEVPFDSDRKRMSVVVRDNSRLISCVKGAPDLIFDRCTRVEKSGGVVAFDAKEKQQAQYAAEQMARSGLRVLALARRPVRAAEIHARGGSLSAEMEDHLIFSGLVGMMDAPRPEVTGAVLKARKAGIETIMVTGDHPHTAAAIGRTLGIGDGRVVSGKRLDSMSDDDLKEELHRTRIFARVSPRHKLRIIRALKRSGHIVAMTGDGINDAPAVKEADIGIAMGLSGTDVTREAAAIILSDDNYATIVAAIEEGRGIYDNVRKFIRYLLACNTGEVLAMLMATVLGMPLPLLPIQILWVNLVTDGMPAIALGIDPPEEDVMSRPPRSPVEGIFARGLHMRILLRGFLISVCTVAAFFIGTITAPEGLDAIGHARTLALTTLVISQLVFVFQCRSEHRPLHHIRIWENRWLVMAVAVSFLMQVGVLYFPPAAALLRTVPLRAVDWGIVLFFSLWSQMLEMITVEIRRAVVRRFSLVRV